MIQKTNLFIRGKAKRLYETDDPDLLIMEFCDDISAFDGEKKDRLDDKGMVNNKINSYLMEGLSNVGLLNHHVALHSDTESIIKRAVRLPVECIVRNVTAGGICRRLGAFKGQILDTPIFEFCLKDDSLHDPIINEHHIRAFGWATTEQVEEMKRLTIKANYLLKAMFAGADLTLVDFKLEFGVDKADNLIVVDEISPDGCRLWDKDTKEIYDKDRYRNNLGDVVGHYKQVATRLGIAL